MPTNFSQQERRALLNTLHPGRANAISAAHLAISLGYSPNSNQVKLRRLIKECIEQDGDLIGATTGRPAGFFQIATLAELERYLDTLEGRVRSDNARRNALILNWNNTHPSTNRPRLIIP